MNQHFLQLCRQCPNIYVPKYAHVLQMHMPNCCVVHAIQSRTVFRPVPRNLYTTHKHCACLCSGCIHALFTRDTPDTRALAPIHCTRTDYYRFARYTHDVQPLTRGYLQSTHSHASNNLTHKTHITSRLTMENHFKTCVLECFVQKTPAPLYFFLKCNLRNSK